MALEMTRLVNEYMPILNIRLSHQSVRGLGNGRGLGSASRAAASRRSTIGSRNSSSLSQKVPWGSDGTFSV